jgi:hypothetical protein
MRYVAMTVMMVVVMVVLITSLVPNAQLPVKLSSRKTNRLYRNSNYRPTRV